MIRRILAVLGTGILYTIGFVIGLVFVLLGIFVFLLYGPAFMGW